MKSLTFQQTLLIILGLFSAWYIGAFLVTALASINYPYHLEWMEGQTIDVIARVVAGEPIYTAPTIEYVPFIYTPFYYYVAGIFADIFGVDFFAGRLVSLLSIIGVGCVLYGWVRREIGVYPERASCESKDLLQSARDPSARLGINLVPLLATGLFFSTYELSSRWFDVARVDSLFLLLTFAGLYVLRFYESARASVAAGLLLTAAFFTKQPALIIAAPALIASYFIHKTLAIRTATTLFAALFIGFVLFQFDSEGWFGFYTYTLPASHHYLKRMYVDFWTQDMLANLWPLMLVCFYGWVDIFMKDKRKALWYLALAAGCMAAAYSGRLHRYGWVNVLMPAHAMLALCAALSLGHWLSHAHSKKALIASILLCVQLTMLLYNPAPNIPSAEAKAMGDAFLARIAKIEGDIFIPEIQFVQTRVGKKSYAYGMAAVDIIVSDLPEYDAMKANFKAELRSAIEAQRFGAVIPPLLIPTYGVRNLEGYYGEYYGNAEPIFYPRNHLSGHIFNQQMQLLLPIDKNERPSKDEPQ